MDLEALDEQPVRSADEQQDNQQPDEVDDDSHEPVLRDEGCGIDDCLASQSTPGASTEDLEFPDR